MLRYAITDRFLFPNEDTGLMTARCGALAQSGIDFILVREKDLPVRELVELCRNILMAVRERGERTKVLVASRADVAVAAGLDGVHLSSADGELTLAQVGRVYGSVCSGVGGSVIAPPPWISVSCHSGREVERARQNGASAVLFAPVFGKTVWGVESTEGVGIAALRSACRAAREMPVFALGGVTEDNAAACMEAGAAGVAGIRMFFGETAS